jgi:DNA replication licensing factor MCM3
MASSIYGHETIKEGLLL